MATRRRTFELKGSDEKLHNLADFKGKKVVVLAWFPRAFTGGCTAECKSIKENGDAIRKFDVAYFTASTDAVEASPVSKGNKAFAESLGRLSNSQRSGRKSGESVRRAERGWNCG